MRTLFCAVLMLVLVGEQTLVAQVQGQWVGTGAMESTRQYHALVPFTGGNALAAGGVDIYNNVLATAEVYNYSAGTWKYTNSMVHPRQLFPAVVLANGKVLVSGGLGVGNTVRVEAELYDPKTGQWTSAGALHVARFAHTATLLSNGNVLVTGGCTASNCSTVTAVSEVYNPTTNSWTRTGSLNTARSYHSAVSLTSGPNIGKVLVIGSYKGTTTSCELYDPSKGTWSYAASTNVARYLHTSTLLPDGKVLVTGGKAGSAPLLSAELYDPAHNTWTPTGKMTIGRYAHTATLLGDGTALVAGGEGQPWTHGAYLPTDKVDIYTEAKGTFAPAPTKLSRPRAYHATTLVGSGQAMADGGIGYTSTCCVALSSAEYYTPLSLTFSASSLNFGVLQKGLTSAPQMVTISNVSSHSVVFSSIAKSGDYVEINNCPGTLNAGQSCTIRVTFSPTAAGTRNGAVTLHDNCPGNPVQTLALSGIGATNAITALPGSLSFPSQNPGTRTSQNVTLYNDGATAVNFTKPGIAISPSGGTFTQTNNCPATLNPNTNCVIQVAFTPPDAGNYNATLSVTDTDHSSPQTVPLSGVGANN